MGFRLQLYDETGAEIGWMTGTRTAPAPDMPCRSPFEYEYEITGEKTEFCPAFSLLIDNSRTASKQDN